MMYALLTMPLAMPLEKVADQTISAKADGCSMSTVAFSGMDYMTGPNQMTMVNLFNAAASTRTVEFIGAPFGSGCGKAAQTFTYHRPRHLHVQLWHPIHREQRRHIHDGL